MHGRKDRLLKHDGGDILVLMRAIPVWHDTNIILPVGSDPGRRKDFHDDRETPSTRNILLDWTS